MLVDFNISVGSNERWISMAHRTASRALANSTKNPSNFDKVFPADHLVRQIHNVLDLDWVHKELTRYYSHDPVLMIRMLIVGYVHKCHECAECFRTTERKNLMTPMYKMTLAALVGAALGAAAAQGLQPGGVELNLRGDGSEVGCG